MSLKEYKRKRDFKRTPEPTGGRAHSAPGRQFVIQKHDASRLHYDFRLELGGTLKSWAVPKGPSLDPDVKSLAVQVEDHPLEYAGFEGVIPQGQYGGGTVMVWDRGAWEPEGDPAKGYRQGKLKFRLAGEKLHGGWSLVRMGGRPGEDGKNWLLIKHRDDDARPTKNYDVLKRKPASVLSGRDLDEIAADADRAWESDGKATRGKTTAEGKGRGKKRTKTRAEAERKWDVAGIKEATKARQPSEFKPQLATPATDVPVGDRWLHELKFDGYRILAFVRHGRVRLVTRRGNDWTLRFPSVAQAVAELPIDQAIFDGEVVALSDQGISEFQRLQNVLKRGDESSLVYYVFDLPHYEGYDLTNSRLLDRKELLARIVLSGNRRNDGVLRYSDHVQGEGETVLRQACRGAMEGIMSKRIDSPYVQARSPAWLKVKCTQRQEFVIGGYTAPSGARVGFGALLVGYYRDGELMYCGRVGTGFTAQSLRELTKELKARRLGDSPFAKPLAASQRRGVTWVRPELVAEVEFAEWTDEGLLRQPSFQGLREDKLPKQVTREEAKSMPRVAKPSSAAPNGAVTVAGVRISHPDRFVYPEQGITKQDLAEYYEAVAEWILPHLVDRPLTLVRCPKGRTGQCFYQKHLTGALPESVRGVMIEEKDVREEYMVIDDLPGLLSLVQMGVLEIHPWPARADKIKSPDRLVFDLDPGEGAAWKDVVEGARLLRRRLTELGLECFLRTTGGKGLHVVAPLVRRQTWDQLKSFAKAVADDLVRRDPDRYLATMSKAKRRGKVYVDYLRNQRGATAVASYSTRARMGAPIAAPLAWDELSPRTKPNGFNVANMPKRLAALKTDPWNGFFTLRQAITRDMERKLT
jgi:bifunctional non-homologous end joining protein LigD